MHLVSVDRVTASVEGRTLFADVSFGLSSSDRVGLVGPNGSGKTTLLRIVAGDRAPDAGNVIPRTGLRIGWLPQDPHVPDEAAIDVVLAGDPLARPDEAAALLDRLGVDPAHPMQRASGGQRRRVSLAATLLAPSDLLILDEPTNHLDVDTIDWLEEELSRRDCGILVVTHDRYVLERLANRMLDLDPSGPGEGAEVVWHDGSYSSLLEARAERAASRRRATDRARNLFTKEVAWLRRGPKARTSKPKFRVEQVERLREAAADDPQSAPLELGTGRTRLGDDVFTLDDVTVRRGEHAVLDGVELGIGPGERIGVVGPNGAGKSTLLHLLAGRIHPDAGRVRVGRTVHVGLYEQEARTPPADVTALDTVLAIAEHIPLANGERLPAGRLAERFGFDAARQRTPVTLLSGGERRRLALLHLLIDAPNVILLDEPTNDLDLDTLAVLEDHLDGFTGTLIVASHDRYTLDRLTDRTIAVGDGGLTEHLDWEGYRQARTQGSAGPGRPTPPPGPDHRGGSRGGADRSAAENRRRQQHRRRVRSLEQRIERLEQQRGDLDEAMAAAAEDPDRLLRLQREVEDISAELAAVEEEWLELAVD